MLPGGEVWYISAPMESLYELSWWVPAALAIGAVAMVWMGITQLNKKLRLAGAGLLLAAVGLAVFSHYMESEREMVLRRSRELVAAIEKRDRPAMLARLHPNVQVMNFRGRDALADAAINAAEAFKLQSAKVVSAHAEDDEGLYVVHMQVAATFDRPSISNWKMKWAPMADGWILLRAESEGGPGFSSATLEGIMGRWKN